MPVADVSLSPDGDQVSVGRIFSPMVDVWNREQAPLELAPQHRFNTDAMGVRVVSSLGRQIIAGGDNGRVTIWDSARGENEEIRIDADGVARSQDSRD